MKKYRLAIYYPAIIPLAAPHITLVYQAPKKHIVLRYQAYKDGVVIPSQLPDFMTNMLTANRGIQHSIFNLIHDSIDLSEFLNDAGDNLIECYDPRNTEDAVAILVLEVLQ